MQILSFRDAIAIGVNYACIILSHIIGDEISLIFRKNSSAIYIYKSILLC